MKEAPTRVAVLDACVLVQAPLRDTLLRLAESPRLYRPLRTDEIIIETMRALERQIGLAPSTTAYLERELRRHFRDSWITGYEPLVAKMTNDSKDRHVLAAAHGGADIIVTFNKRHFPARSTAPWKVLAIGPTTFLEDLYATSAQIVQQRIKQQASDLGRSIEAQLDVLGKAVPWFVELIRRDLYRKGD